MSITKAKRALKALIPLAEEMAKIVAVEGEKSDREQQRLKELASEIIGGWELVVQEQDSIERLAEEGPRTKAEELAIKGTLKALTTLGGRLWKARKVDVLVVSPANQKRLQKIRGQISRWKRALKKAPKRTASAGGAEGEGQEKPQDKAQKAERSQKATRALA